jgi:hypothetical protein
MSRSDRLVQLQTRPQKTAIIKGLHKTRQVLFSVPGYLQKLSRLRRPGELYSWVYFKCPNLFPLREVPMFLTVEPTNTCNL